MGPWCGQMGVGGWVGTGAFWLVMLALAVWAIARLFPVQAGSSARATLDARLARGEIDPETYRLIRDELDGVEAAERGPR